VQLRHKNLALPFRAFGQRGGARELRRCFIRRPRGMPIPETCKALAPTLASSMSPTCRIAREKRLNRSAIQKPAICPNYPQRRIFCQRRLEKLSADPNSLSGARYHSTEPGFSAVIAPKNCARPPRKATAALRNSYSPARSRAISSSSQNPTGW